MYKQSYEGYLFFSAISLRFHSYALKIQKDTCFKLLFFLLPIDFFTKCEPACYCSLGCRDWKSYEHKCYPLAGCDLNCTCNSETDSRLNGRCGQFDPENFCSRIKEPQSNLQTTTQQDTTATSVLGLTGKIVSSHVKYTCSAQKPHKSSHQGL